MSHGKTKGVMEDVITVDLLLEKYSSIGLKEIHLRARIIEDMLNWYIDPGIDVPESLSQWQDEKTINRFKFVGEDLTKVLMALDKELLAYVKERQDYQQAVVSNAEDKLKWIKGILDGR